MHVGHEDHRGFEQNGKVDAEGLAEHVAQGQHIEDTDRLERAGIFSVLFDFTREHPQVRTDVAVTMNHAFGLARRT